MKVRLRKMTEITMTTKYAQIEIKCAYTSKILEYD